MSEKLLRATLRLFALLTMIDGVEEDERKRIRRFLQSRLNRETADRYMDRFEQLLKRYQEADHSRILSLIKSICRRINTDLTVQQKMFLMLELLQLMYADQYISEGEETAMRLIGEELNIPSADIARLRAFVTASTLPDFADPEVLIIKADRQNIPSECRHLVMNALDGFIAVLHLSVIKPFFVRYMGHSECFINHVALQYGAIEIFATGSTLRGAAGTLYFSDILGQFKQEAHDVRLHLVADSVSYRFANGDFGVRDVTLEGRQGQLIGIMGASGSGKSTLLNVLNGSEVPTSGHVLINGVNIHEDSGKLEGLVGYVPQDDLLIEDLTVYENLYYAARLCFDRLDTRQLQSLVDDTLTNLGLYSARDFIVGSPLRKTISGGQRKRLNIGLELLREPMVLFVDEPTSGLSSRDSENIMDLLKELSLKGKLIFVVIHQPSSEIFKMFDRLMILDLGGFPIYYGSPLDAVLYFREAMQLIERHEGACPECGNINPEQIFDIVENKIVDEYGRETDQRKMTPHTWHEIFKKRVDAAIAPSSVARSKIPDHALEIPGVVKQTLIFLTRDVRAKLHNRQYLVINLLEAPLLAAILAILVRYHADDALHQADYVFRENMNIPAYIFMGVVVALFMGLTVSAEEIIRDRKILKREAFLNLSRGSYLSSKLLILMALSAVQTLTFVSVGNAILAIQGMWWPYWIVLFSVSYFANVLGLNISSAFNSAVTIYILIPILLIPQILLSGVVVQFDQLNPTFAAKSRVPLIGDAMASRWAYEALMVTQYKDNAFARHFFAVDKRIANAEYSTVYYIPRMESMLDFIFINQRSRDADTTRLVGKHMEVLHNEFEDCLREVGFSKWSGFEEFDRLPLDSGRYAEARAFLGKLQRMYLARQRAARNEREEIVHEMVNVPNGFERFRKLMVEHTNKQVSNVVQDHMETQRILEHKGRLVRRIYPIYMDPEPRHVLDIGAPFYAPKKHLAGLYFDTLYFNIAMIWLMSVVLVILLYFDVLRKVVNSGRSWR